MRLIDAHVHLQEEVLEPYLAEVLQRARQAGIMALCCNGTGLVDWEPVLQLARTNADIIPFFGLHPWFVENLPVDWLTVLEGYLAAVPSGIGEIGLDRWYKQRDETAQEQVFRAQLQLAQRLAVPVTIHCLRAWGWLLNILREVGPPPGGMLIHAYGGSAETITPLAEMGAYFSVGGSVLDERKLRARASLPLIPPDRLLIESDAPAMPPPQQWRPYAISEGANVYNEPANLPAITAGVAELLQTSAEELADRTRANALRFLGGLWCPTNAS